MRAIIGTCQLELTQGDITLEEVSAIVNAANSELAGGGGVDGAIHRRGGPSIMEETDRLYPRGCPTGSAVITSGGQLSAAWVIHAVGPVWRGGMHGEAELLAGAYQASLNLALEKQCESIAFPALSTGAYAYPMDQASRIALTTVKSFLQASGRPALVRFVLFSPGAYGAFVAAWDEISARRS